MPHAAIKHDFFAQLAESFGHRLIFAAAANGVYLQQYDCSPGGWQHDPIPAYKIAVQDTGHPKIERAINGRSERQLRPSGLVSISPADLTQRWSWNCAMRVSLLFIDSAILDDAGLGIGIKPQAKMQTPLVQDDKLIKFTVGSLVEHHRTQNSIPRLLLETAGRHLGAHLLSRYVGSVDGAVTIHRMADWQLKRVLDFIECRAHEDIGLGDLAAVAGMTPHYFCRAFRLTMGTPPYKFLIHRRIERARELLASTDNLITQIALDLGFASHAHFSTAFRKSVGCAPAAFRKALR